jgi:CheY-like chemotaxis protein
LYLDTQILLVEDESRVAATLRKALERAGHSVLTAGDGRDALGIMQKAKVDLVIADIVMPNVDGLELIKEIRRTDQTTKILAISGEAGWMPGGYLRAAGVFGADYALKKPFSTGCSFRLSIGSWTAPRALRRLPTLHRARFHNWDSLRLFGLSWSRAPRPGVVIPRQS